MAAPRCVVPGPGEESVWDYPVPPRVEAVPERLRVTVDGEVLAETTRGLRVLETAGAPVYYLPPDDVRMEVLEPSPNRTVCEWKGEATYYRYLSTARRIDDVAWSYPDPSPRVRGDPRLPRVLRGPSMRRGWGTNVRCRSRVASTVAG